MMNETVLARSLRNMYAGGAVIGLSLLALPALAQQAAEPVMQRVEITGSSIKRIAAEGSLPVQTLTRAQIEQSGVSNVADLVAALPAMQGFITSSTSVNGGGSGVQTASVHAIGTQYTLVLLNGRRMAPYGTGSAVNLASIPLAAVERVEILTDGASTLYGSDAIAGVVNFILKKNQRDFTIEATANLPQEKGGKSSNFAISKGWGDLDTDRYNVLVAYSHDQQKALNANQREFARTGARKFEHKGKQFATWQTSINSTPANVEAITQVGGPDNQDEILNHDLTTTGGCSSANTFSRGNACRFDYASTVQLLPELKRDSIFSSATFKLNDETTLFAEMVLSKFSNQARYAPAAQPLTVFSTNKDTGVRTTNANYIGAYNSTIAPLLGTVGINPADVSDAYLYYRGVDAGGREDKYQTDAAHVVLGMQSRLAGWDLNAAYTHSQNKQTDTAVSGYMSGDKFEELVRTGAYNPFRLQSGAAAILAPAVLHGVLQTTRSKIDVVNAGASRDLFALDGGSAMLGVGADFTRQDFKDDPSQILLGPGPGNPGWTDVIIGGGTGSQALDASRNNWGAFAELLMPISKTLEATAAVRYDSYDAVDKKNVSYDINGVPSNAGEVGNSTSKATYKLAARWTPVRSLLVRGSYGTGFKAPTMNQIADPLKNGGSSNFFPCPTFAPGDPRLTLCRGSAEYGLLTSGNALTGDAGLKPETSKQATIGFRVEPMPSLSFGLDMWDVKLKNQIQFLSQSLLFGRQDLSDKYMRSYYDPIQKSNTLVAEQNPLNLANSHYRGLDWDTTWRFGQTPIGALAVNWTGTYMLKAEQSVPGATDDVVETERSIGRFDSYNNVTFRVISRVVFTLKGEKTLHSLTTNYRSGYHDQPFEVSDQAVREVNPDGSIGAVVAMTDYDVKRYVTLDYQLKATVMPNLTLTGGIKNLLDKDPPLSIRNAGGGNQVGYDGRYTDPLGRTFYLTANYKF
ncbi:MAG TPA: TonB-dependent receptor [Telluria sp.]|jgi:iron complex outermembrane receptor protein